MRLKKISQKDWQTRLKTKNVTQLHAAIKRTINALVWMDLKSIMLSEKKKKKPKSKGYNIPKMTKLWRQRIDKWLQRLGKWV